ncbi:hypothetical protein DTL42_01790 [Bremerella cremea]|uniref:DUF2157 domain-containing protein n=1 Tax=Bremerella cremea TaxID=1031537 RepID=A0A368KWT9_9BACT|nr:hypothetical protein [Bremerella cremea]RCS53924.1 hypothetical protein DTL42_01790 [Bremerella cremea]
MSPIDRREDLRAAIDFVLKNLRYWLLDEAVQSYYQAWLTRLEETDESCQHLKPPVPDETPRGPTQEWRYRAFLEQELEQHIAARRLNEKQTARLLEENRLRGRQLRPLIRLSTPQVELAEAPSEAATEKDGPPETPSGVRLISLLEAILDPRSLQYLMMLGGCLLVLGLVIWLATQGFFDNPVVVASLLAGGNLAVLGLGAFVLTRTRFQLAGRGLALVACMLMPFHLWFYDAQGLIVLDEGGHLWIPALAIALLYTVCALLIRDTLFVYAVVGGVTLTGLMILGDQTVARFWEGAAASTLLVALGAAAIHAERAFATGEGAFSRHKFGLAFFRAGHCVLLAGLVVLLNWIVCAWTYRYGLSDLWFEWTRSPIPFAEPTLATSGSIKLLALGLTLGATYLYGYSYAMVRRHWGWIVGGTVTFLWSELILVDLLPLPMSANLVMTMFAATAILLNGLQWYIVRTKHDDQKSTNEDTSILLGLASGLSAILVALPILVGLAGFVQATFSVFALQEIGGLYVLATALTTIAAWFGAQVRRRDTGITSSAYAIGTGVSALLLVFGLLSCVGLTAWDVSLPIMLLAPLGIAVMLVVSQRPLARAWQFVAFAMVTLLIPLAAYASTVGIGIRELPITGASSPLVLSLVLLQACLFFHLMTLRTQSGVTTYLAAVTGVAALWQTMYFCQFSARLYLLCFGGLGLAILLGQRVFLVEESERSKVSKAIEGTGHLLLSISGVGCLLMSLNQLVSGGLLGRTVLLQAGFIVAALLAALLPQKHETRHWYRVLAIGQGFIMFLLITFGLDLEAWQKTEIFLTTLGLVMLAAAHVGWAKEQDQPTDGVTLGLVLGSLLSVGPVAIGMLAQRFGYYEAASAWQAVHEIGALTIALLLLGSGILCRLRATTLVGGVATLTYVATLLVFVRLPDQLQHMAVYMMIGGGVFFGVALLLSIYRDTLLALPERVRNRQGLFRVLTWR